MANITVVFDANILYSSALRDLFMWLALSQIFNARWSDEIHSEWMRNVLKNRPELTWQQLTRTKNLMNENVENCLVTGYEDIIPQLQLPDPDDRHILAAAIVAEADFIVTFNIRDFPNKSLAPYGIKALHPDDFILSLFEFNQQAVCQAVEMQRKNLQKPPKTRDEYLATLKQEGLLKSANLIGQLCYQE